MKIILIGSEYIQQFPVLDYGGIESCVENLAFGMKKNNLNFKVIVPKRIKKEDYNFNILESNSNATNISGVSSKEFCQNIEKIIKDEKPDIIWSQSPWSANYLNHLNIPMIVTIHDSVTNLVTDKILKKYNNVFYRFVSKSQLELNILENDEQKIKEKSFYCHTGLSDDEYELHLEKEKYYLWVAGLNWGLTNKGLDIFIKLSQDLTNKEFVCYGSGNEQIEQYLKNIKISNFHYFGKLNRGEEHRKVFKKANKFLMLTRLQEAFGRTTIESLSKGTPVIATNIGANKELIHPNVGTLINSYNEIINSIEKCYNTEEVYEYSKKFHVNEEIKNLLKYSNLILSKGKL